MKKYNNDIPGLINEKELMILSSLAGYVPENGSILEIGCFLGRSTTALYMGKHDSVSLDVVDKFKDPFNSIPSQGNLSVFEEAKHIALTSNWHDAFKFSIGNDMYSNINVFEMESKDFEKTKNYNLTFIDGSHTFENVRNELDKFLSADQLVVGDDFLPSFPGVTIALSLVRTGQTLIVFENTKLWALVPKEGYWREVFKNNNLLFL
jgi:hypothetical protein